MKKITWLFVLLLLSASIYASGNIDADSAVSGTGASVQDLYLGSKVPYPEPGDVELTPPPAGYEADFIYWLNRHGSRNLSGFKYDKSWLDMIALAESEGQLTEMGKSCKERHTKSC